MDNFTVTKNITVELNEVNKSSSPTEIAVFFLILNILLSITASLGNAVILVALHIETSLHPPTKLLYRCLAITDLCVGVIIHPVTVFFYSSLVTTVISWKMFDYVNKLRKTISFVLCQVSILTCCAISVDRLLALLSGLRYRYVVTLPRIRAVITCFWLIGSLVASINPWSLKIAFIVFLVETVLSLTTSAFSYGKIFASFDINFKYMQSHKDQLMKDKPLWILYDTRGQLPAQYWCSWHYSRAAFRFSLCGLCSWSMVKKYIQKNWKLLSKLLQLFCTSIPLWTRFFTAGGSEVYEKQPRTRSNNWNVVNEPHWTRSLDCIR